MRKIAAAFVISSVALLIIGTSSPAARAMHEEVRIFSSLEEAAQGTRGPLVLVFFSLDCPACWEELFEVRYVVLKNSVPIDIIGISADTRDELEPFLDKHAVFTPVVSDPRRELFRRFRVRLEPVVVVLEDGRVLYQDNTADNLDSRREKLRQCLLEIASRPSS
jgi:peroxiredoxin